MNTMDIEGVVNNMASMQFLRLVVLMVRVSGPESVVGPTGGEQ